MLEVWNQMRLQRYKEDVRGFRTKRIETQLQARIAKGVKPRRRVTAETLASREMPRTKKRMSAGVTLGTCSHSSAPYISASDRWPLRS